jgi:hypothetical protein
MRFPASRWNGSGDSTRLELLNAIVSGTSDRWRVQMGGATDRWDLALVSAKGSRFFLRTVTEYHSRNFTMTYLELSAPALDILRIHRLLSDRRELLSWINDAAKRAHLQRSEGAKKNRRPADCASDKSPLDSECNSGEISQA